MVTHDDIRKICGKWEGSIEGEEQFGFGIMVRGKHKGYCWSWRERVDPKKSKVINDRVLAVRTPNLQAKEMLLASGHPALFTEPHYNGFPAVLVKLDEISAPELEDLLFEAWQSMVPK